MSGSSQQPPPHDPGAGGQPPQGGYPPPAQGNDPPPGSYPPQGGYQQPPPGGYPPPQGYEQPKKKHTVRNVILIVLALLILGFVGCTALLIGGVNEAVDDIDKENSQPGGPDNPLEIKVGEAFTVSGFDYQAGWGVKNDVLGDLQITNLKVENNRDDKDGAIVEIKFLKGDEVLALADCTTSQITPGQTVKVSCLSTDRLPKGYDTITINDTF